MTRNHRIAVLGAGTVGAAVVQLLDRRPDVTVAPVLVRDPQQERGFADWPKRITTDPSQALDGADIVIELMGGVDHATDLMLTALRRGARVVTANKAALAERWDDFLPFLSDGRLYFEAAVMAGTPVVGVLAGALRGAAPVALQAVLNGTCNVILSGMESGQDFAGALAEATRLGFAEADPSLDVDGIDAAHKLTLLARLAFDPALSWSAVVARTEGVRGIDEAVVAEAVAAGDRVRLVGSVVYGADGWEASVRPMRLRGNHPLAGLEGSSNGMLFRGEPLGEVFLQGPGAGGGETAVGVLGDVLTALADRPGPTPLAAAAARPSARSASPSGADPSARAGGSGA